MKSLPKSKMIVSLLLIGLAAIIVGGATMAWFTDDATVADATFTAGTVKVSAGEPSVALPDGVFAGNINPGDCSTVTWKICNIGTKKANLGVKLDDEWVSGLTAANVSYAPAEDSGWVLYEENDGSIWAYYVDGPVDGTYNNDGDNYEPKCVDLVLVLVFDGATTNNDYQGDTYKIGGEVLAAQATHDASDAIFGEAWGEVNSDNYVPSTNIADMLAAVKGSICWNGEDNNDEEPGVDGYDDNVEAFLSKGVNCGICVPNYVANISGQITAVDQDGNTVTSFNDTVTFDIVVKATRNKGFGSTETATVTFTQTIQFTNGVGSVDSSMTKNFNSKYNWYSPTVVSVTAE